MSHGFLCIDLVGKRWKRCRTWLGCYRNTCGKAVVGGQSKQRRPQEKNYFGWRGSRYFLFIGNHLTKKGHIAVDMSVLPLSPFSENKIWRHPDWHGQCALIDLIFTARRRVCKALVRFAKRTPLQRAVAYHLAAYLPVGLALSAQILDCVSETCYSCLYSSFSSFAFRSTFFSNQSWAWFLWVATGDLRRAADSFKRVDHAKSGTELN